MVLGLPGLGLGLECSGLGIHHKTTHHGIEIMHYCSALGLYLVDVVEKTTEHNYNVFLNVRHNVF